ncbi:MAG: hypothetical protein BGO24_13860 [Sphingomonas sp. 67-36]|nr:MAG: hypothetical protein BGO24_13860 [Sphingomonas sp. 67-36]
MSSDGFPACCSGAGRMSARDDLLASLNELLEAERAGARVALDALKDAVSPEAEHLLRDVRADESRWCARLSHHIARLEGQPSRQTGAFHGKAMAIADPVARLAFLNRGQAWVVRKLEALMPGVADDDALRGDLQAMWDSYRVNIGRTEDFLATLEQPADQSK